MKVFYPKLFDSSLWCFGVVPQFNHGNSHGLVKDDIDTVHLREKTFTLRYLAQAFL